MGTPIDAPLWLTQAITAIAGTAQTAAPTVAAAHEVAHASNALALAAKATSAASALGHIAKTALPIAQAASNVAQVGSLLAPRPRSGGAPPMAPNIAATLASRRFAASVGSPLGGTFNNVQGSPQLGGGKTLLGQ